ncbi:hypothetical protein AAU01_12950 [Paenarthrobacter aurescens]|uniref:Uncharacterized protein n=1 Tax=Paenarthrobacter aurescens TaxID=43663 RepID=A0A4Y3N9L6_PAEAU|nr:hypothetical protein AAU01_12950 [Paenarthrobacter aurescens]
MRRHDGHVKKAASGDGCRGTVNPPDGFRAGLSSGSRKGVGVWIDANNAVACRSNRQSHSAGAATKIQHPAFRPLIYEGQKKVVILGPAILLVVEG